MSGSCLTKAVRQPVSAVLLSPACSGDRGIAAHAVLIMHLAFNTANARESLLPQLKQMISMIQVWSIFARKECLIPAGPGHFIQLEALSAGRTVHCTALEPTKLSTYAKDGNVVAILNFSKCWKRHATQHGAQTWLDACSFDRQLLACPNATPNSPAQF
jgi:hypothetical protein